MSTAVQIPNEQAIHRFGMDIDQSRKTLLLNLAQRRIPAPGQMCMCCLTGEHSNCSDPNCPCVCSEMF